MTLPTAARSVGIARHLPTTGSRSVGCQTRDQPPLLPLHECPPLRALLLPVEGALLGSLACERVRITGLLLFVAAVVVGAGGFTALICVAGAWLAVGVVEWFWGRRHPEPASKTESPSR